MRQRIIATALGVLAGVVASVGALAVVGAAFTLSFDALRDIAAAAHIRASLAWLYPVAVDGAMAVAAVTAVVLRQMRQAVWYPWTVVVAGAAISIGANALHAYVAGGAIALPAKWAMTVSAVPPLLLALSVHLLIVLAEAVRHINQPTASTATEMPNRQLAASTADEAGGHQDSPVVNRNAPLPQVLIPPASRDEHDRAEPPADRVQVDQQPNPAPTPAARRPANGPRTAVHHAGSRAGHGDARQRWLASLQQGTPISGGELARMVGVDASTGRRWVRAWRAELDTTPAGSDPAAAVTGNGRS